MKLLLLGSYFFLLCITMVFTESFNSSTNIINSKEAGKVSYPKKVNYIKKNILKTSSKRIADITENFRDLPTDDLAFIKELDKQFKLHGGKFKIKVENNNCTETKNSKRTIDGELGYGYAHNGYHYNQPKYMFYPYSQQDIAHNAHNFFLASDGKTEVTIEPSYSYELKPQTYITHNEPQIDIPNPEKQHEEPVIVLRIPGPAKYATHLQMLLQKYLEIRAAQYLHILEEAEQRNNQQQHQLQQLDYGHGNSAIANGPIEHMEHLQQHVPIAGKHEYEQQMHYGHQNAVTPQSVQYPEVDNVYHSYKNRYSTQREHGQKLLQKTQPHYTPQQSEEEHHTQYEHQTQHQHQDQHQYPQEQIRYQQELQEQPQFYYTHQQQYAHPEYLPANKYHHIYLVSMPAQGQADYGFSQPQSEKQHPIYVQDQPNQNEHSSTLPIAENNPRPSHTKVIFTSENDYSTNDYQMYQLPSIKPNERLAPTSTPGYHQDFQQQQFEKPQGKPTSQESFVSYSQHYNSANTANPEVVAITQRTYNYHAHNIKDSDKGRGAYSRRASMRKESNKVLQKSREFVHEKKGAETGSDKEFKTT